MSLNCDASFRRSKITLSYNAHMTSIKLSTLACRAGTISDFYYTIIVAKRIHSKVIIAISIDLYIYFLS